MGPAFLPVPLPLQRDPARGVPGGKAAVHEPVLSDPVLLPRAGPQAGFGHQLQQDQEATHARHRGAQLPSGWAPAALAPPRRSVAQRRGAGPRVSFPNTPAHVPPEQLGPGPLSALGVQPGPGLGEARKGYGPGQPGESSAGTSSHLLALGLTPSSQLGCPGQEEAMLGGDCCPSEAPTNRLLSTCLCPDSFLSWMCTTAMGRP